MAHLKTCNDAISSLGITVCVLVNHTDTVYSSFFSKLANLAPLFILSAGCDNSNTRLCVRDVRLPAHPFVREPLLS